MIAKSLRLSAGLSGVRPDILVRGGQGVEMFGLRDGPGRFGLEGVTDEVLVSRVSCGDERALSELYERYGGVVYSAGMRYLGDRTLDEDLVQDVFFSVWRGAASFDSSKANFATWIYRITRNRATDLVRRRRSRVRTMAQIHGAFREPEESDRIEEVLRTFDVVGVLSELSAAHREVLVLAYFGGLSQREISDRTGIPLGTIKSRTTAALRAAREKMIVRRAWDSDRSGNPREWRSEDG